MLWSDPDDEPPKELRDAQDMLRRLGVIMAVAVTAAMVVAALVGLR
ncbi:morphogenic membrane protein MmpB [Streptomyces sp. LaBMicrA B280]